MKNNVNKFLFVFLNLFAFIIFTITATFAASGEVDTNFQASAYKSTDGNIAVIEKQPDGKVIVAGFVNVINGVAVNGIARLNADGSLDKTFDPPDFAINDSILGSGIQAVKIQPDGKILVGGSFDLVNGILNSGIKRLNSDGSLDPSFNFPMSTNSIITDIELQSSGKIIIGGSFNIAGYQNLARINPDSSLDNSFPINFNGSVNKLTIQNDDKILIGSNILLRLNSDGTNDSTFPISTVSGIIYAMELQSDGKILIGGTFQSVNGSQVGRIARFLPDGSIDPSFNLNMVGANGTIWDILIRADGKILIGGTFSSFNGVARKKVALLNTDGTLDNSFETDFNQGTDVNAIEQLNDGKVLIGYKGTNTGALVLLNSNGSVDTSNNFFCR